MTRTKVVSIRIPAESYKKIMDECKKKGISITEWYERKIALAKQRIPKQTPQPIIEESIPTEIPIEEEKPFRDLSFFTTLISFVLFIGVSILCFSYSNENKAMAHKYEKTLDSLNNELFIKQTEVGRYEMGLELLKEEDSISADKFQNILKSKIE
jgi:hypothetical protein